MDYPVIEFNKVEPLQDYYTDGEHEWSVARLVDEAKDLKPFDCPLAALDISHQVWAGASMYLLAFHCKKVMEANLKYPIIIAWDGSIADGRHRIIKALIEGKKTIKAVRFTWRVEPDRKADQG